MKHLLAFVVGLVLAVGSLAAPPPAVLAYSPDDQELAFLGLINDYRAQHGLGALSLNSALGDAADYHSQDMGEHNYFAHTLSDGTDAGQNIRNFGYTGSTWGENIAAGMASAQDALVHWQNSPEHNAGMLNGAFQEIGIGRYHAPNSAYGWYWTTTFGGGAVLAPQERERNNDRSRRNDNGDGNGNGGTEVTSISDEPPVITTTTDSSDDAGTAPAPVDPTAPGVTNADGANVTATDDGLPAVGDGNVNVFDDVNTGGVAGDTTIFESPPPADPPPADPAPAEPPPADPAPAEPPPADGTMTETVDATLVNEDGTATELGPSAPAPVTAVATCASYLSWYDAQLAYEAAGMTAADPNLVAALDPDYDGIACEELMTTG